MVGDIRIKDDNSEPVVIKRNVPAGGTGTINNGEPTKSVDAAAASPYLGTIAIMVDGDGSTSQRFAGVAKSVSTDTAVVAGICYTWLPMPGIVYAAKAKTASLVNTQALVDALKGKRVVFDLTASSWTVDTAAADAVANCVVIVDGEYQTQEIYFMYADHGTFLNFSISA